MGKGRMEAFSDGVFAIIITIMVLELKAPHASNLEALRPLAPIFLSYILSFIYVGIYWNNHHHTLHAIKHINGAVLWANLHLLFWLSLVPFVTDWMGTNHFAAWPVALYGVVLFMAAIAFSLMTSKLIRQDGPESQLAKAYGSNVKGKISPIIYLASIGLSFVNPWIAFGGYILVAIIWFIPDSRIEKTIRE